MYVMEGTRGRALAKCVAVNQAHQAYLHRHRFGAQSEHAPHVACSLFTAAKGFMQPFQQLLILSRLQVQYAA